MAEESNGVAARVLQKFLAHHDDLSRKGRERFSARDVERLRRDDRLVHRLARQKDYRFSQTYTALDRCLRWRKQYASGLTEAEVDPRLLKSAGLAFRGRDLQGNHVAIWRMCKHTKGSSARLQAMKRYMIWVVESFHLQNGYDLGVCLVIDMKSAGMRNVDLELVKFFIDCLLAYYPGSLQKIVVVEKPWFRAGISNLIKYWIPEQRHEDLHSVGVKDLTRFISRDQLIRRWAKVFDGEAESDPEDPEDRPLSPSNSVASVGSFVSLQSTASRGFSRPHGAGRRLPKVPMMAAGARAGVSRDALHRRSLKKHTQRAGLADPPALEGEEGRDLPSPIRRWSQSMRFQGEAPEVHPRRASWLDAGGEESATAAAAAAAAPVGEMEVGAITRRIDVAYPDMARVTPPSPTVPSKTAQLLESPILFETEQRLGRLSSGSVPEAGVDAEETRKGLRPTIDHSTSRDSAVSDATVVDLHAAEPIISVIPPEELVFTGALNEEICEVISLENLAVHTITYKVRTTQPDRYRVRPRSGVLGAGEIASLQVLRKSMENEASVPEKDHFLIMSAAVTEEERDLLSEPKDVSNFWKNLDSRHVRQTTLRTRFDAWGFLADEGAGWLLEEGEGAAAPPEAHGSPSRGEVLREPEEPLAPQTSPAAPAADSSPATQAERERATAILSAAVHAAEQEASAEAPPSGVPSKSAAAASPPSTGSPSDTSAAGSRYDASASDEEVLLKVDLKPAPQTQPTTQRRLQQRTSPRSPAAAKDTSAFSFLPAPLAKHGQAISALTALVILALLLEVASVVFHSTVEDAVDAVQAAESVILLESDAPILSMLGGTGAAEGSSWLGGILAPSPPPDPGDQSWEDVVYSYTLGIPVAMLKRAVLGPPPPPPPSADSEAAGGSWFGFGEAPRDEAADAAEGASGAAPSAEPPVHGVDSTSPGTAPPPVAVPQEGATAKKVDDEAPSVPPPVQPTKKVKTTFLVKVKRLVWGSLKPFVRKVLPFLRSLLGTAREAVPFGRDVLPDPESLPDMPDNESQETAEAEALDPIPDWADCDGCHFSTLVNPGAAGWTVDGPVLPASPRASAIEEDNVVFSAGSLRLLVDVDGDGDLEATVAGARVTSRAFPNTGCFEVRLQSPPQDGIATTFSLFSESLDQESSNGGAGGSPAQMDLERRAEVSFDTYGRLEESVFLTAATEDEAIDVSEAAGVATIATVVAYGVRLQEDSVEWYIDGELVHSAAVAGGLSSAFGETVRMQLAVWVVDETMSETFGTYE